MTGRKILINTIVLASFAFGATWLGCKSDDETTNPTATTIAGPSNLRAYSVDSTRVGLVWSVSTDETKAELLNYILSIKDTIGNALPSLTFVKGQANTIVTGLQEGTIYVFTIKANVASGAVTTDSSNVRWSPAKRLEFEGSAPINVFESADPNHPSGLDVYSSTSFGPVTRSLTVTPGNALIDLYVATLSGSQDVEIRSASLSGAIPSGRVTTFDTTASNSNSLSSDPRTAPPPTANFNVLFLRIPAAGVSTGRIYWGKTADGNYFRMLITHNGTSLISGPTGERFLTVQLSYQRTAGNPYARPITVGGQQQESGR